MNVAVKTPLQDLSRKDLLQICPILKSKLNKGSLTYAIQSFENYLKHQTYIKYRTNLRGVAHHSKLGPARRPLKIYRYVISALKNLKETFNNLYKQGTFVVERILINSTGYLGGGIIRASRGRASRKNLYLFEF